MPHKIILFFISAVFFCISSINEVMAGEKNLEEKHIEKNFTAYVDLAINDKGIFFTRHGDSSQFYTLKYRSGFKIVYEKLPENFEETGELCTKYTSTLCKDDSKAPLIVKEGLNEYDGFFRKMAHFLFEKLVNCRDIKINIDTEKTKKPVNFMPEASLEENYEFLKTQEDFLPKDIWDLVDKANEKIKKN